MDCYAIGLGDCEGGISREHYVSRSVLEIAGKTVQISGFPWQEPDTTLEVGIGALASKVLCRRHNAELSPLDETGRKFVTALKSCFDEAIENEPINTEVFSIAGDRLELWLLKMLCGLFAAHRTLEAPEGWTRILFQREPFPEGSGMHFFGEPGPSAGWFFNVVRIILVRDKRGVIAGAKFGVGGLPLLLAFGKPLFSEEGMQSVYRPDGIVIEKDAKTKRIDFSWSDSEGAGSVHLHIVGPALDGESGVRPFVQPDTKQR